MAGTGPSATAAAAAAIVLIATLAAASNASEETTAAKPTCSVSPDGRTLEVAAVLSTTIVREGDEVRVGDLSGSVSCAGTPTVTTIDTIAVIARPGERFPDVRFDLRGGSFAPGATDEGDGSSEIEMNIAPEVDSVRIAGSGRAERITAGRAAPKTVGINLNADEAEADPDVILRKPAQRLFLRLEAGGGGDRLSANGGPGFDGPVAYGRAPILLAGGGKDRVTGSPGKDVIDAIGGPDVVRALAGNDEIETRDSGDDRVLCGPGDDALIADRGDQRAGCEDETLR
jgi:hypothetical protein